MNFSRYTIWVQQRPAGQTLPTWTCLRVPLWLPVSRESLDERGHAVHNSVKGRRTKRRAWRRRAAVAEQGGCGVKHGGGAWDDEAQPLDVPFVCYVPVAAAAVGKREGDLVAHLSNMNMALFVIHIHPSKISIGTDRKKCLFPSF